MSGCILHAYGKSFDVDGFLAASKLDPYEVYRAGDSRIGSTRNRRKKSNVSGLKILVSEKESLADQVSDAVGFLKRNDAELKKLSRHKGVEALVMDVSVVTTDEKAAECYRFPVELLELLSALRIHLELSRYAGSDE